MRTLATRTILVWTSLAMVSLLSTGLSHARIDPETVVGLWLFDDNGVEQEQDISGNENHGVIQGRPNWTDGKFGEALEYDGADDCVEIPDLHAHIKDGFTVTFWLSKPDQDLDNRWLFGSYSGWSPGATSFLIWKDEDPGHGNVTYFCIQGKNNRGCCSYSALEYDSWNHIAATYDKSQLRLYVNGVEVGSNAFTEEVSSASGKWYVGYAPGHQIMGVMDEVAVFNVALTVDEIKEIMNEGLEKALGITAVFSSAKLTTTWGSVKY
jgi:hypothetical protein